VAVPLPLFFLTLLDGSSPAVVVVVVVGSWEFLVAALAMVAEGVTEGTTGEGRSKGRKRVWGNPEQSTDMSISGHGKGLRGSEIQELH
jgi:hypothetical protein